MAARFPGFPAVGLTFLRDLKANNNREWFTPRKMVYEQTVKRPMTELVLALAEEFRTFAPDVIADPAKCIYRIYRDVRFSNDKSPYKTHVAASFYPRGIPKHAGAGYYVHIAPEEVLIGGGVYMPGSQELFAIRQKIAAKPEAIRVIVADRNFKKLFGELEGEKLKRVPKGFAPDDPAADLLVHKQFLASVTLPAEAATEKKFFTELVKYFKAISLLIDFLNEPLAAKKAKMRR
jgi:uncharacterized protein (TIGR02453 family)